MLQQAEFVSGSGGAMMEVCLGSGDSAGQVGQVGQLLGTAERGCQVPPGGQTTLLHGGSDKSFCFMTNCEMKVYMVFLLY